MIQLADAIHWSDLEAELAGCYAKDMGRPGNATRLMVGLHYLKHAFDESDESVLAPLGRESLLAIFLRLSAPAA